ncbi:tRNA (guanine-N(7)-)-methyltransferase non-catalytic subunit wuho [Eurosta solidaginis]|uniref:tRNA (guanine-N(7)-)-methyltransferase non-catalytic subunit wuho n=1 Tax=Eurosta solidaginis TaxID=178769 RepID=UPI00353159BD
MTTLFYADPELVIALNRKVVFVNPNDLQVFKEILLPDDLTEHGLKLANPNELNDTSGSNAPAKAASKTKEAKGEVPTILHVKLAPDQQLCAVTTAGQKAVLLYQCRSEHAKLISARSLARASSALTFSADSKLLLVTDKSGDCYEYDCVNVEDEPRILLGHLSIVYDVLWTRNTKYIITCDRDDKIRITNYPDTHDIHGYCLGHKEFVSGLALLDDETLVSVSGDKTLRVWNFISGRELSKIELPAPALRIAVRSHNQDKFQLAVLLYQADECIFIYELNKIDADKWMISESTLFNIPEVIISNLCFVNQNLYAAGILNERFKLKVLDLSGNRAKVPENWTEMVEELFKTQVWKPEDISSWFKKRYDNVTDYLERKKRRIEEKQK